MLPIPILVRARCIFGVSPSMPPWSTHGFATFACQRTLTILLPLQCCRTWVRLWKYAATCVCCGTQCTRLVFAAYALSGGISRSLVGKNTCRLKKQRVPHKLWKLTRKADCDRFDTPWFAAAGVCSRVAQSVAGLRLAYRLDWIAHRFFFQEPPRSDRHISFGTHQLALRLASL